MAIVVYDRQVVTDAGGTYTVVAENNLDALLLVPTTDPLTMLANIVVNFSGTPFEGQQIRVGWGKGFTLNGNTFTVNGISITDNQALKGDCYIEFTYINGGWGNMFVTDLRITNSLDGDILLDGSVTLSKLADVTDGSIVAGGASNVPTELTVAGVLTAVRSAATLVYSYVAGSITNAAISASAAIARSKLAAGTASHVVINDGSGNFSSEAALAKTRGGFGADVSAANGFVKFNSGTLDISAIPELITIPISFENGEQCNNRFKMPFAGTVVEAYAVCTKAIAGTDAATITLKNNSGTTMGTGTITFAASDPLETAYTVTPSSNNTFVAGDVLYATGAKTTAGGKALLTIKVTRTA